MALFLERGFEATTIDDIATAADVSRRSFFHYFASKEDVVAAWQEGAASALVAEVVARPAGETMLTAAENAIAAAVRRIDPAEAAAMSRLSRDIAAASAGSIRLTAAAIAFSAAVSMVSSAGRARILGDQRRGRILLPGGDHVLFRREIMEEAAPRHVGRGRDVVDGRGLEAALQEQRHRRTLQPLAGLLLLALAQAGRRRFLSGGQWLGASNFPLGLRSLQIISPLANLHSVHI